MIQADTRGGQPLSDFQHPIREGSQGRNDEEGAIDPFLAEEGEERDDLDGLAQALRDGGEEGREDVSENSK